MEKRIGEAKYIWEKYVDLRIPGKDLSQYSRVDRVLLRF
jgi:hypothetical protein